MAAGDLVVFEEAKAFMLDGGWGTTDDIKCALITVATVPTAADATPALGDYTQVTAGGNYTAGGTSLGQWATLVTEAGGTVTFDSGTNPTWAQNAGNPTNARYALVYNDTQAGDPAIAFVDLGAAVNMTTGALTITWDASGIFTIA
jgi:hypothetical protein